MVSLIFDDNGKLWYRDSPAFRKAFCIDLLKEDPTSFIIEQLGGVGVSPYRDGTVLHFNPERVSNAALAGFYRWLPWRSCSRVCLAHGTRASGITHRLFGSIREAHGPMYETIWSTREPQLPFAWLQDRLEHLQNVGAFAALFEHWRSSGGAFDEGAYGPLLDQFAQNRFIIFQPRSSAGDLEIVRAGAGLHIPDKKSLAGLAGSQLVNVADQAYGRWSSSIYRGVLEKREPRFDHIHAKIHWPTGPVERRYWRLILPCIRRDGSPLLLGVSCEPGRLDAFDSDLT